MKPYTHRRNRKSSRSTKKRTLKGGNSNNNENNFNENALSNNGNSQYGLWNNNRNMNSVTRQHYIQQYRNHRAPPSSHVNYVFRSPRTRKNVNNIMYNTPLYPNNINDLNAIALNKNSHNIISLDAINFSKPVLVLNNDNKVENPKVYQSNSAMNWFKYKGTNPHTRNAIKKSKWMKPISK